MSALGAQWERELAQSAEALGLCEAAMALTLNDRRHRRFCDLQIPLPGGRTLYVECKATALERFPLGNLRQSQRDTLERLHGHGHAAGVAFLFRGIVSRPQNVAWWVGWEVLRGQIAGRVRNVWPVACAAWAEEWPEQVASIPRTVVRGVPCWDLRAIPEVAAALEVRA